MGEGASSKSAGKGGQILTQDRGTNQAERKEEGNKKKKNDILARYVSHATPARRLGKEKKKKIKN